MGGCATIPERRSRPQCRREYRELWMTVPGCLYTDRVKSIPASNFRSMYLPDIVHEPLDPVE